MQTRSAVLLSALVMTMVPVHSAMLGIQASPIAKVLQLLTDMQSKIVHEGDEAQKVFREFSEWCEERSRNVDFEIKTGKADINDLEAIIGRTSSNIMAANSEIERLASSIATNEADVKAATQIRATEAQNFEMEEKDLVEIVSALERAIGILEREMRKGGAMMLQLKNPNDVVQALKVMVDAAMLPTQDAQRLAALVQSTQNEEQEDDDDGPVLGAPAAAAYTGHSNGIIDTLESLLDKAKDQLEACRKKEVNQKHNFKMLEQSLKDEIKFGEKDLDAAKKELSSNTGSKATAEGELDVTSNALKQDEKDKATLHTDCMEGAADFEAATKSRGEELKAIAEAKKIITETTSGADAVHYGLDQVSFLQTRSVNVMNSAADLAHFEAVHLVRDLARKSNDRSLALLANRMSSVMREGAASGEDPFEKVKAMIREMIVKLEKDAGVDASHKAYCDKEMAETSQKLLTKNAAVSKISTEIDSMSARSAELKEQVAALQKALADIYAAQVSMDHIRKEEHTLYVKSHADMQQGLEGIKLAMKILRDYYAQAGDSAAHEVSGAANGVIGLLEVVESDLAKGVAEMNVVESTAQAEYDRVTREAQISKATKEQGVKYKTKEIKGLDVRLAESKSDLQTTTEELTAVQEYDTKIKQICIAKPETYAQRSARREAEIAGLKEALQILRSETVLIQRQKVLRGGSRRLL